MLGLTSSTPQVVSALSFIIRENAIECRGALMTQGVEVPRDFSPRGNPGRRGCYIFTIYVLRLSTDETETGGHQCPTGKNQCAQIPKQSLTEFVKILETNEYKTQ